MSSRTSLPYLLIAIALLATTLPSTSHARKLTLGPAIGVNRASFGGDTLPDYSYESIRGFTGGVLFDFYLKDDVALTLQPMYVPKGADQVLIKDEVELDRIEYRTSYFSIPLGLKVTGTSRNRMYVQGTIDFNFLLDGETTENGETLDISDELESFEISTSFGVGGLIAIGGNYLMIEGRYVQGLSNIAGPELTERQGTISIKNTGFMILVGWLFQLGGESQ